MNPHAQTALSVAKKVGKYTLLTFAWMFQYLVYVPFVVWPVKAAGVAVRLGLWGIVLLCLPVIGWAILILILLLRPDILRKPKDPAKRSPYRPWGI